MKPLVLDLFCGLFGWSEGFLEQGYRVVGIDICDMCAEFGIPKPSGDIQLILQDVLTIHGSQFKDATIIVASPPCQTYSWMAMPWKLAKAKAAAIRADTTGESLFKLNRLFNACFRIQAEASLAAGRKIPMVVENVRGAQPWVGRAAWNFGSFYLWGDVPALMPIRMKLGAGVKGTNRVPNRGWTAGCAITLGLENYNGTKQGGDWFNADQPSMPRLYGSKSPARKMASAMIAKIPFPLSQHIARTYRNQ